MSSRLEKGKFMNLRKLTYGAALWAACLLNASGQSFVNLSFENTIITTIQYPGGTSYFATIPGWSWSDMSSEGGPNTVHFNTIALDAPAVTLHGTNSPYVPTVRGSYAILLQGGSPGLLTLTNGASIFQTGQVPIASKSMIYFGGSAIMVTFDGHSLSPVAVITTPSLTVWGVDISAYAGQTGELRFTAPWMTSGFLDGIQFSTMAVPEPSTIVLGIMSAVSLMMIRRRKQPSPAPILNVSTAQS